MHFAYPPRKSSNPPPFKPRSARVPTLRRSRLKVIALVGLAFLGILFLLSRSSGGKSRPPKAHVPSGKIPAVIVTVLDETNYDKPYLDLVRENRRLYAEKHGEEIDRVVMR